MKKTQSEQSQYGRWETLKLGRMFLFGDRKLTPAERHVWLVFWCRAGNDGMVRASYASIAEETGYCERHVKRIIAEMIQKKALTLVKRGGNLARRSNHYKIHTAPRGWKPPKKEMPQSPD